MQRALMEPIKGVKIPIYTLDYLEKVADLIYFDGPLLSWFKDQASHDFLFYWVDTDGQYNRWLVFRTTNEHIEKYIKQRRTLFDIVTKPVDGFLYSVDIAVHGNELVYENVHIVTPSILPESYLPGIDSYYDCLLYTSPSPRDGLLSRMPSSA